MRNIGIIELLMPPAIGLAFLALSWLYMRGVNLGRTLNSAQRRMLLYGFWFVFGSGYISLIPWRLQWADWIWIVLIATWGILIALVAWWRSGVRESS